MNPMTHALMPTYGRKPVCFVSGKGAYLTDDLGKTYLDFVSGVAVNALGHGSEVIQEAILEQAQSLIHVSNLYWTKPQIDLANQLVALSKGKLQKVFFCNSGTEALEGAIKVVRKYGKSKGKSKIIYMSNAFHGRSMGALSITGQPKYQEPFEPLLSHCIGTPFNDVNGFLELVKAVGSEVAGIFIEPIQGEGGVISASPEFLSTIHEFCKQNEALLVLDEVQCGAGRLGHYFAYQALGLKPDVVCMAKGLGGGVPIGAFLTNEKASVLVQGDHGSTYGGNPLVCAVANAVTDTISKTEFLASVIAKGAYLKIQLEKLKEKGLILGHRGMGLLQGIQVHQPNLVVDEAFSRGLLLVSAGEQTVRILPPLNVSYEVLDTFYDLLKEVLLHLKASESLEHKGGV